MGACAAETQQFPQSPPLGQSHVPIGPPYRATATLLTPLSCREGSDEVILAVTSFQHLWGYNHATCERGLITTFPRALTVTAVWSGNRNSPSRCTLWGLQCTSNPHMDPMAASAMVTSAHQTATDTHGYSRLINHHRPTLHVKLVVIAGSVAFFFGGGTLFFFVFFLFFFNISWPRCA